MCKSAYEILEISQDVNNKEINAAKNKAMLKDNYSNIRQLVDKSAHRLLNPKSRFIEDLKFPKLTLSRPRSLYLDLEVNDIDIDLINPDAFDSI